MIRNDIASGARGCPEREDLAAFLRGELSGREFDSIADHLSACEPCEASVRDLRSEDTILMHLRRKPEPSPLLAEAECRLLEERARLIAFEASDPPTLSDEEISDGPDHAGGRRLPAVFGAYQLLEQLGRGGMGVVYKARQQPLKRLVALKMVRAGLDAGPEERSRFQREGEAIARIKHSHVVQIHEFGEHEGQLYFSMELLEGGNLAQKLDGRPMAQREAAELVAALARAVHAAHRQGIVHRDLKPSNVVLGADGQPKITDFGLAKLLDGEGDETQSDAILGTPAYMAPEQARGEIRKIGPASDVYALGAILFETLTGRPPFKAESRLQTVEWVKTREPEPPSRCRSGLARGLEAICLKCLEKEPEQRYASALALAEDLERWLRGEPTLARRSGWPVRLASRVRRHRRAGVAVCLLLLPLVLIPVLFWPPDPDRPLKDLERKLRRGETVTLLGDKGGPVWSRWGSHPGVITPSRREKGCFTFSALDPTVLTLLPDPRGSYRFRAEVRHEDSTRLGEVGIAFVYSRQDSPEGPQHCFCTLTFNDHEALHEDPTDGHLSSRVRFLLHRLLADGRDNTADHPGLKYFLPASLKTPGQLPWRALAAEVRPEGIDLFWEGERLAHFSTEQILDEFAKGNQVRRGNRMVTAFPELQPAFSPRDALGLFVFHGRASFRHVLVEPLP